MRPPLSYAPLLPVAIAMIGGILVEDMLRVGAPLIFLTVIPLVVALIMRNRMASVLAASFAMGCITMSLHHTPAVDWRSYQKQVCNGIVTHSTHSGEDMLHLTVRLHQAGARKTGNVSVSITTPMRLDEIAEGDYVAFAGDWSGPSVPVDLPGNDDRSSYYYRNGISARCYVLEDSLMVTGRSDNIYYRIRHLTSDIARAIDNSGLSPDASAFITAIVTGNTEYITKSERDKFSSAGVAHILALSGMHVGLLILFVSLMLMPLDIVERRPLRLILTIIIIWLYAFATGLGASVVRASVMATMYMMGRLSQRNHSGINGLSMAAIILLLFNPMQLFRPGMQLSFAAVLGILLLARRLNPVPQDRRVAYRIAECILLPITAVIGTGALSVLYFHRLSPLYLLANIPIAVILPPLFVAAIILTIISASGGHWQMLTSVVQWLYDCIQSLLSHTASDPGGALDNIYITPAQTWLIYLAIAAAVLWRYRRRIVYVILTAITAAIAVTVIVIQRPEYPDTEYFITRDARYTNIMVTVDDMYYLVTTSERASLERVAQNFARDNSEYLSRRRLRFGGLVTDSIKLHTASGRTALDKQGDRLYLDGKTVWIYNSAEAPDTSCIKSCQYLLVTRYFTGDILQLAARANADTLLLTGEINGIRARRYRNELDRAGVPYINMRRR